METLRIGVTLMLIGILTLGVAESTIDEQITAIQNATTAQERVQLMNRFKMTVTNMNQEQRKDAINQLRDSIQSTNTPLQTKAQTKTKENLQAQQRSRIEQMKNTQLLEQTQQMNQHQSADQAIKEGIMPQKNMQNGFMGKR